MAPSTCIATAHWLAVLLTSNVPPFIASSDHWDFCFSHLVHNKGGRAMVYFCLAADLVQKRHTLVSWLKYHVRGEQELLASCPSSPDRSDTVELMEVILHASQAASGNSGPSFYTTIYANELSCLWWAWATSITSKNMELVLVSDSSCISSFFLHACKLLPSSIGVFVTWLW